MEKQRLEFFSDGVFAIVLTLLVLDLKAPTAHGVAGAREIAPTLVVHALTFALVGLGWTVHHGALAKVTEITTRTLRWNLLALFWITLIPFAAKLAAERPLEALGPSLLSASYAFYGLSTLRMRRNAVSEVDSDPLMQKWLRDRYRLNYTRQAFAMICAASAWVLPAIGYVPVVGAILANLFISSSAEAQRRLHRGRADLTTDLTS